MGNNIDLIVALRAIKQFDQFTEFPSTGSRNKLYVDRSSNVMYRWTGSAYVQVTGGITNFLGAYDAAVNSPTVSSGSGTIGDMFIVSTDNLSISPAIDGITELRRGDTLISEPRMGGGSQWVRIETAMVPLAPISINSNTTISTLDTTYLVDASSANVVITVPLSATANQGAFIRIIKEDGENPVVTNSTPPQTFLGGDDSFTINNISESVTLFSSGNASDGWVKIQDSRSDRPTEEIEFLKPGNTQSLQDQNWRVATTTNGLLAFERREGGAWVEKQSVGDSVHTDIFYATGVAGGMRFEDPDNDREVELVRLSPGGTLISFGDENLTTTIVSDDNPIAIIPITGTPNLIDVNTVDTDAQAGTLFNFQFTSVNGGRIESVVIDTNGLDRTRIEISENATGISVYETTTLFDFENNNGGGIIPAGRQTLPLQRVARIQPGLLYDVTINVATSGTINGNATPTFVPYLQYNLLEVEFCDMELQSRTRTHISNLTIDATNYRNNKNNTLLFTNTTGIPILTISDGAFTLDDFLEIKHYSSAPSMSVGVDITQLGTGADIEGQSTLQLRNNTSVTIKYIGNNKWRIISSHGMSGSAPVPITPEAHAFSIDIPNRVNVNASPDTVNTSHNLSYSVTNHSLITSSVLHIGESAFVLPLPVIDGVNTAAVNISGISLATIQNYNMYIELNMDTSLRSNVQVLRVVNLPQQEAFYYGINANDIPATVNVSTLTLREISATETFNADFEIPNTNWSIILTPSNYTVSSIIDRTFNQEILNEFTYTQNVRTIGSQSYDSYVLQSNAGVTATLSTSITVEV